MTVAWSRLTIFIGHNKHRRSERGIQVCELRTGEAVIHPTFNSAVGHLLATCLHRAFEIVFLWVILKCVEYGLVE